MSLIAFKRTLSTAKAKTKGNIATQYEIILTDYAFFSTLEVLPGQNKGSPYGRAVSEAD